MRKRSVLKVAVVAVTLMCVVGASAVAVSWLRAALRAKRIEQACVSIRSAGGAVEVAEDPKVYRVYFMDDALDDNDVRRLAEDLAVLPNLEALALCSRNITDRAIPYLGEFAQLRYLLLCGSQVTDQGVKRLQTQLPSCTIETKWYPEMHTKRIEQACAAIEAYGGYATTSTDLEKYYVYLAETRVDDNALRDLANDFAALPNLVKMNLCGTRITDEGLQYLAHLKTLENLDLAKTAVTRKGVEKLQRSLPYCRIYPFGQDPPPGVLKDRESNAKEESVDGGSKVRRGAAEFCSAGSVKVSLGEE